MRAKLVVPLLLALLVASTAAAATSWKVDLDRRHWRTVIQLDQMALSYEHRRVERKPRGIYVVRTRLDFREPQVFRSGDEEIRYSYSIQVEEFDCFRDSVRTGGRFLFNEHDEELHSEKAWRDWEKVESGSVGAMLHSKVCSEVRRRYGGQ